MNRARFWRTVATILKFDPAKHPRGEGGRFAAKAARTAERASRRATRAGSPEAHHQAASSHTRAAALFGRGTRERKFHRSAAKVHTLLASHKEAARFPSRD